MNTLTITFYAFLFITSLWVFNYEKPVMDIQPVYMYSENTVKEEIAILNKFITSDKVTEHKKDKLRRRIEELKD